MKDEWIWRMWEVVRGIVLSVRRVVCASILPHIIAIIVATFILAQCGLAAH
jgi:hypothetical protein